MRQVTETSPLLRIPSVNQDTQLDEQNATKRRISLGNNRLIEAEIDTGEVEDAFSWRKLWKYTGPG